MLNHILLETMCVKLIHDWIAIHYVVNSAGVDMYQKMDYVTLPAIQNNVNMMVEIVLSNIYLT